MTYRKESFFELFSYSHMMHDAIDQGLVYEDCLITRNIIIAEFRPHPKCGIVFREGDTFEAIWFSFRDMNFQFIHSWVPKDPYNYEPDSQSFIISQKDLAPYLVWNEKDLPGGISIDNHTCKGCGNTKCSKNELSCWKCGFLI